MDPKCHCFTVQQLFFFVMPVWKYELPKTSTNIRAYSGDLLKNVKTCINSVTKGLLKGAFPYQHFYVDRPGPIQIKQQVSRRTCNQSYYQNSDKLFPYKQVSKCAHVVTSGYLIVFTNSTENQNFSTNTRFQIHCISLQLL